MENEIIKKLDDTVLQVIGNTALQGFEKAHVFSAAILQLEKLLTDAYMKPIMALQGNKLGFKTDKDKTGGYDVTVVRRCLIEAVLMGLQPTGNQFNIIAGNTYPTKEGCGYLLNNFPGLQYDIVCGLPRINADKSGAAVEVTITWTLNGVQKEKVVPIPIKTDAYSSVDSIIGKATRKGRAWLLSRISGVEVTDGDVQDTEGKVVSSKITRSDEEEKAERIRLMLADCKTTLEVDDMQIRNPDIDIEIFKERKRELGGNNGK